MVDLVKGKGISKAASIVGTPINGFAALNAGGAVKYISSDGSEWLKSGWAETNFASYPDANHSLTVPAYSIDVSNKEVSPQGVCMDSTHFYIIGYTSDLVHKYLRSDGSFVSSHSVAAQDTAPMDIAWDGTNFFMTGGSQKIHKYNASWLYLTTSAFFTDTSPEGITFDTTNSTLWVITTSGVMKEYNVTLAGTTGRTFTVSGNNHHGLGYDGTDFWVTTQNIQNPRRFSGDASGTYLSTMNNVNYPYIYGFDHDPYSKSFIPVFSNYKVFMYVESIGITASVDANTGSPIYTRIK